MMVMVTQRHQIWQIRQALIDPVHDVMDIGEDAVRAAREAASTVAPLDLPTLRVRGKSPGPPLEHGVSERIIESERHRGVATDSPDRLATQKAQSLDFRSAGTATQEREIGVGHDEEVGPPTRTRTATCPSVPGTPTNTVPVSATAVSASPGTRTRTGTHPHPHPHPHRRDSPLPGRCRGMHRPDAGRSGSHRRRERAWPVG